MSSRTAYLLVLALFLSGLPSTGQAHVLSYKKLTPDQLVALRASQDRLERLDRAMHDLSRSYARKQISTRDYAFYEHDLTCYIGEEAKFQDELLTRPPGFSEDQRELLQNIAKYAVAVPLFLAGLAARCACSPGASYSLNL